MGRFDVCRVLGVGKERPRALMSKDYKAPQQIVGMIGDSDHEDNLPLGKFQFGCSRVLVKRSLGGRCGNNAKPVAAI
jgi:hypothetical protein